MRDIRLLTVCVLKQRDPGGPIRIVLDLDDLSGNAELAAFEVDLSLASVMAASTVPHTHVPVVVTTAALL